LITVFPCLQQGDHVTINRYRYFYACAFDSTETICSPLSTGWPSLICGEHGQAELDKGCRQGDGNCVDAACDLDEKRALELVAAMGWIKSHETYARFMMKRFVGFLAERGVTRERPVLSPKEAARLELRSAYEDNLRRQRGLSERTIIDSWRFAEQFLDLRFPEAADDPGKISASDIARFAQARVVLRAPRDKTVPSHLRNFFRYLFRAGKISTNLANAVPRMAQRFGALPRHLSLEQVGSLWNLCRSRRPCDW
jgi:integrase/recombinase XerD